MRTLVLAAAAALAAFGPASLAPAAAGDLCEKTPEIRAAFEPRLDYERERAQRVAGADADWPASIQREFQEIPADGLDCRSLYDRYTAYVDGVIARNDRLEQTGSATRGMIFRKW
jgi:hypothetical protein